MPFFFQVSELCSSLLSLLVVRGGRVPARLATATTSRRTYIPALMGGRSFLPSNFPSNGEWRRKERFEKSHDADLPDVYNFDRRCRVDLIWLQHKFRIFTNNIFSLSLWIASCFRSPSFLLVIIRKSPKPGSTFLSLASSLGGWGEKSSSAWVAWAGVLAAGERRAN